MFIPAGARALASEKKSPPGRKDRSVISLELRPPPPVCSTKKRGAKWPLGEQGGRKKRGGKAHSHARRAKRGAENRPVSRRIFPRGRMSRVRTAGRVDQPQKAPQKRAPPEKGRAGDVCGRRKIGNDVIAGATGRPRISAITGIWAGFARRLRVFTSSRREAAPVFTLSPELQPQIGRRKPRGRKRALTRRDFFSLYNAVRRRRASEHARGVRD